MNDRRRHAPVGRLRPMQKHGRSGGLAHLYASRKRRPLPDLYERNAQRASARGSFRWIFSSLIAAAVGAMATLAVILGSSDNRDSDSGLIQALTRMGKETMQPIEAVDPPTAEGLKWNTPKADRLPVTTGVMATRFIYHEPVEQKRGNRRYLHKRPYYRFVIRLAAVPPRPDLKVPAFDPLKLHAGSTEIVEASDGEAATSGRSIDVRFVDLLDGALPQEDGQEMDANEVADLVARTQAAEKGVGGLRAGFQPEGAELTAAKIQRPKVEPLPPFTTVRPKATSDPEDGDDEIALAKRVTAKAQRGESLSRALLRLGVEAGAARAITEAAKDIFKDHDLEAENEVRVIQVPTTSPPGRLQPVRVVVTREDGLHRLTVRRGIGGGFTASAQELDEAAGAVVSAEVAQPSAASVYASLYRSTLAIGLQTDLIEQILKVHAYDTDYRRRSRAGDILELVFDARTEASGEVHLGELLRTSITIGGLTYAYWRFRTADGLVDYYDENGLNSRKFLLQKPVALDDARLTSGFGMRNDPLLGGRRMHTGIDWAAPTGTPILAAGNGVVEEAGWKGAFSYGNYVKLRHPNGYHTTYGHLSRYAPGLKEGLRVTQGQVIGYVGNTGKSTAPHLHYEVLINASFVNPLRIENREKQLAMRNLDDFRKERLRVETMLRRSPVRAEPLDGRP